MTEHDNNQAHQAPQQAQQPPASNQGAATGPSHATSKPSHSANRLVAGVVGMVLLIIGALSFTALGEPVFFGDGGGELFGVFQVSGLLIAIRIVMGLVLLLATRDSILGSARTNIGTGVVSLLIATSAPFIDSAVDGGVFALTQGDYVVFAGSAIVLIAAGVFLDRDHTRA